MKKLTLLMFIAVLSIGIDLQSFAQEVKTLPEIIVTPANYKYLQASGDTGTAQSVRMLQRRAATYNIKKSDFYEDDYEGYFISFYIPEGKLLAVYDQEGKIIRTAERYKNVSLPKVVSAAVSKRFPGWKISQDLYLVTYATEYGGKKEYKILLENGDKRLRIKTNEKGEFL